MLQDVMFLIIGLIGLSFGADLMIRGSKNIARHYGISEFFIGLAFISIGTSIPEIAVSIAGGLDRIVGIETSGIVIGNKIGSAFSQITLIFGILAFLVPLRLGKKPIIRQGSFLIAAILLVFGLSVDGYLSRLDGAIAILIYFSYYAYLWFANSKDKGGRPIKIKVARNITFALFGLALVLITSDIVVKSGVALAKALQVHQSLIGVLLVGVGTGVPELAVAIVAWRRRSMLISMGDLIGSNICDLLLALGAGTVISGFFVDPVLLWFDLPLLLLISCIVLWFLYTGRRVSRKEGLMLIMLFLAYALFKIFVTG